MTPPLLVCHDLDVRYGPVQVLFGVDFKVERGEIVALLGTNGAGKSTLLRAISSTLPVREGRVLLEGDDVTNAGPGVMARRGVCQVPGGRGVFPGLTVAENLRVASWLTRDDHRHVRSAVDDALERFPILAERWDEPAANLSGGEQQMLTLAQALLARPQLLLIDELSLGLAPSVVGRLIELVRSIAESGVTIVLVEQSVNVALTIANRAVFMEKGQVRFEGDPAELLERPEILRSVFLGDAGGAPKLSGKVTTPRRAKKPAGAATPTTALLDARELRCTFGGITAVDRVSLTIGEGEVVGLLGSNGAGKTTLFDLLSGYTAPDSGSIRLDGEDITEMSADRRARAGLGRSFQDARLFPSLTVSETIAVAFERYLDVRDSLSSILFSPAARRAEKRTRREADELIDLLGLGDFANKTIAELSTGSRRIVDLACSLAHRPRVLLLDEPSAGIAQREVEALPPLLDRVREHTGASLAVIDHDVRLLETISDRLIALELGRVIAEGEPADVMANPEVVRSYLGGDPVAIFRSGKRSSTVGAARSPARKAKAGAR